MYPYENHINEHFNQLTIKSFYKTKINNRMTGIYICTCQCNPKKNIEKKAYEVIKSLTISCGCLQGSQGTKYNYTEEIEKKYNKLTIQDYKRGENGYLLLCQCDCGSSPKWLSAYSIFLGQVKSCGCLNNMNDYKKMIGMKFYKLTVLNYKLGKRPSGQSFVQLLCKCECGVIKYIDKYEVQNGQLSCGCMMRELLSERGNKNRTEAIYKNLYNSKIKSISKKRNMNYDLTLEEFISIINQPCYYCKEESSNTHYDKKRRDGTYISDTVVYCNGIDRLNPKVGYIRDNVVPCCRFCNTAKMSMDVKEFQLYIAKLYTHFIKKHSGKIDILS